MNLEEQQKALSLFGIEGELVHRMALIATRRGILFNQVLQEAVQNMVQEDLVKPKGKDTDNVVQFPRPGEDTIGDETPLPRAAKRNKLPDPDTCPDEKLVEWLEAVRSDMAKIEALRMKDVKSGAVDDEYQDQTVLAQYRGIEERLEKRLAALGSD
jgi:hypothetical protein